MSVAYLHIMYISVYVYLNVIFKYKEKLQKKKSTQIKRINSLRVNKLYIFKTGG